MPAPTDAELLASAKTAIQKILDGAQEYQRTIPGGGTATVTRANLKDVQAYVNELQIRVDGAAGPPISTIFARMR